MLAEERTARIMSILREEGSVTVQGLMIALDASESTIRRDLTQMDKDGLLTKVYGGAVLDHKTHLTVEEEFSSRKQLNTEDKLIIGKYAASLIRPDDFVYIDAGSTTEFMIDFIGPTKAVFVTNAVGHARKLASKDLKVFLAGGEFKSITDAIVGERCIEFLNGFNFTKGFFGTNGITRENGFTTPEPREAMVKKYSMQNSLKKFVLADSSKFSKVFSLKFAEFEDADILTTNLKNKKWLQNKNVKEV